MIVVSDDRIFGGWRAYKWYLNGRESAIPEMATDWHNKKMESSEGYKMIADSLQETFEDCGFSLESDADKFAFMMAILDEAKTLRGAKGEEE